MFHKNYARNSMMLPIVISSLVLNAFKKKFLLICNAVWVNVVDRVNTKWKHVQYFYGLFPNLISDISADDLYKEFTDYQTLSDDDFEELAWRLRF